MTTSADRTYADRVIEAAKAEVLRYCAALPPDQSARNVVLHVQTHVPLSEYDVAVLRSDAQRVAGEKWTVLTFILPVDPALATETPEYEVKASLRDEPMTPPDEVTPIGLAERELLTLRCGEVTLSYLLSPAETWVPVRRPEEGRDHRTEIVIPAKLKGVSRKPLIELRLWDGELELRPTGARRGVTVLLGDRELTQHSVRSAGRLSFVEGKNRTDIDYLLTPWRDEPLEPTPGRVAGSADTYEAVIEVGAERGTLKIAASDVGARPMKRGFRVKAPQFREGFMAVPAHALYAKATSSGVGFDDREWHIKIFRTATPQHAEFLRETFTRQARAIRDVIVNSGGNLGRPPWGIAPVHVIDPRHQLRDAPDPTSIGAPPDLDHLDGLFGEWFGVPGGALSDCFVVVASPELGQRTVEREPDGPALFQLTRFRAMATALDECHRRGIAHCDLKPDNYRKKGGDYVLVDGDSVTELDSQPTWLPFTPPYATKEMLRNNPPGRIDGPVLLAEQIVEHDRFGFGLLVLGAVVGSAWVGEAARGEPGTRTIDGGADLRSALRGKWPQDLRWQGLVDLLVEPFDVKAVHGEGWTCAKWLSRVVAQANAPLSADGSVSPNRYRGAYAAAFAAIRQDLARKYPNRTGALKELHEVVEAHTDRVFRQSRLRWAFGVGLVGAAVFALFAADAARVLGWLP